MKAIGKHLMPNAGTLVVVGLLFLAQAAGALPGAIPTEPPSQPLADSPTLISYQGTLTDQSGNPVNTAVVMEFALYDDPSSQDTSHLRWGPETQTVEVDNGLFHLLLGSVAPIDPTTLGETLYLNIKINDEEMTPRENVTSSLHATFADGTVGNFVVRGRLGINTENPQWAKVEIAAAGAPLAFRESDQSGAGSLWRMPLDNKYLRFDASQNGTDFTPYKTPLEMYSDGLVRVGGDLHVLGSDLYMRYSPRGDGGRALVHDGGDSLTVNYAGDFSGGVNLGSSLNMMGHSISNCGALVEANLQTKEELAAERIGRFEEGDLLCWSPKAGRLEKCTAPNNPLVQAVADPEGRPIVIGAEVIKVIGPVQAGDYLVSSVVPGYAMAAPNPTFGVVIAQALEDFDGEQGIVKAMIRKM